MNKINYLKKKNSFLLKKKNIFIFCIVLIIFTIDRVTKILIKNNLDEISFYVNDFILYVFIIYSIMYIIFSLQY